MQAAAEKITRIFKKKDGHDDHDHEQHDTSSEHEEGVEGEAPAAVVER